MPTPIVPPDKFVNEFFMPPTTRAAAILLTVLFQCVPKI
jgi:hypothetical protein